MTRKLILLASTLLLALSLSACAKKAVDAPAEPTKGGTETAKPDIGSIPAGLKHSGFKYYGLEVPKKMTFSMAAEGTVQEGTQISEFMGMKDGKAMFEVRREGVLATMGNENYAVSEEGVYLIGRGSGAQAEVFATPTLALPADAKVGASWITKLSTKDATGTEVHLETTEKIVRQEKIKVPAGEFDALVISTSGTIKSGSQSGKISGVAWYAAGTGPVKLEIVRPDPDDAKKTLKYTILLEKVGE